MSCGADNNWLSREAILEDKLIGDMVFHQLALILSATLMCLSIGISCWLILDHALHYLRPYEQKQSVWFFPSPSFTS
jgi:hypothetical protein